MRAHENHKAIILVDCETDDILDVCIVSADVDEEQFGRIFDKVREERMDEDDFGGDQEVLEELKRRYGNKFIGTLYYECVRVW